VRAHAARTGMDVAEVTSDSAIFEGINRARWMLVTNRRDLVMALLRTGEVDDVKDDDQVLWTDDFTPLLPLVRALRD